MIPLSGDTSLIAVRDDLDLTGSFTMNSRAGKDKIRWDDSEKNLKKYAGNVLGLQYQISNSANRNTTQREVYIAGSANATVANCDYSGSTKEWFPDLPEGTKMITLYSQKVGVGDSGSESRSHGIITRSGAYRCSYWSKANGGVSSGNYMQFSIVASSAGFLQGSSQVIFETVPTNFWRKSETVVQLSTARPYISCIFYALSKSYATNQGETQRYGMLSLEEV